MTARTMHSPTVVASAARPVGIPPGFRRGIPPWCRRYALPRRPGCLIIAPCQAAWPVWIGNLARLLLIAAGLSATGCGRVAESPAPASAGPAAARDATLAADPAPLGGDETWYVIYAEGKKIGYEHVVRQRLVKQQQELVRIASKSHLAVSRLGQPVEIEIELASLETASGALRQFDSRLKMGPSPIITRGIVTGDGLQLVTETQGKTVAESVAWPAEAAGFFALEDSLARRPMQPGQRRSMKALVPVFNQVATIEMAAQQAELTTLLDGSAELLRIDIETSVAGTTIRSIAWTDRQGRVLKDRVDIQNQVRYRTTRQFAMSGPDAEGVWDLGASAFVPLAVPLAQGHATVRATYRVRLEQGNPTETFPSGSTQQVRSLDEHTADIEVRAVRPPADGQRQPPAEPSDPGDLAPNSLIQSDDSRVVAMAREAAGDESDPWLVALRLERFVHDRIESVNFTQAFATAADVARSLEGDCTEHAVLLAALARARGIPARVAIGLVYVGNPPGLGYHMWTEVYVRGVWIPLDATLGRGGVGAGHLKLTAINLAGADAYTGMLPVLRLIGQLEVELLDQQR